MNFLLQVKFSLACFPLLFTLDEFFIFPVLTGVLFRYVAGEFAEDGSFIGQYGPNDKRTGNFAASSGVATIV